MSQQIAAHFRMCALLRRSSSLLRGEDRDEGAFPKAWTRGVRPPHRRVSSPNDAYALSSLTSGGGRGISGACCRHSISDSAGAFRRAPLAGRRQDQENARNAYDAPARLDRRDGRTALGKYRVTVDTGGTFSDFVCFDEDTGAISITKLPPRPTIRPAPS